MNPRSISTSDIVIATATIDDIAAIYDVRLKTWLATYPNKKLRITAEDLRITIEGRHGEKREERIKIHKERILKAPRDDAVFVAKKDGKVVGFSTALKSNGMYRIGALYVLPEEQSQGVGAALIQAAIGWFPAGKPIYLSVVSYNKKAVRFYKKYGFIEVGPASKDRSVTLYDGRLLPEVEMVLSEK